MMKNLKFKLYRTLNLSKKTNAIFYYFPMDNRFLSRRTRHLSTSIDKNPFLLPIPMRYIRSKDKPFTLQFDIEFLSRTNFMNIVREIDKYSPYTVFIKVRYNMDSYFMVGNQFGFTHENDEDLHGLYDVLKSRLSLYLSAYNLTEDNVVYVELIFRKFDKTLLSEFMKDDFHKLLSEDEDRFISKSALFKGNDNMLTIPISISEDSLGKPLEIQIGDDNKIVQIYAVINGKETNFLDLIIDKTKLLHRNHKDNIKSFDKDFKFYLVRDNNPYILAVRYSDGCRSIEKIKYSLSGVIITRVIDTLDDNGNIIRNWNEKEMMLYNNKPVLIKQNIKLKSLDKVKGKTLFINNPNIGVIDTETFTDNDGIQKIYSLGFKTNLAEKPVIFYINKDDMDSNKIVLDMIDELLRPKYDKTIFYCHNLSGYDVVFILKILCEYNNNNTDQYKISTVLRNDQIIKITISKGGRKFSIRDSYAMLPDSLETLGKNLEVNVLKSKFPYKFAEKNNLFYKGNTPDMLFYDNISVKEYSDIFRNDWSFYDETIKYLENDLNSLYEVLIKANEQIFEDYGINMTENITISGLAVRIFLRFYYKGNIPAINKASIYGDLKLAYYGGITEVYKPMGHDLKYYDVNSLYPYVALQDMPGTICTKIEFYKDNTSIKELFGFFYCKIEAPSDGYLGLLPIRDKSGIVFPVGKWRGWYFSEELKFAEENGYKIEVIKGYSFNRESDVFKEYVETIYKIKSNPLNNTQKSMAKSLLNNLLGRFGIGLDTAVTEIVSQKRFDVISSIHKITSYKIISTNNILVSYIPRLDSEIIQSNNLDIIKVLSRHSDQEVQSLNISSIAISAAVTAYGRIHISKLKLDILNSGGQIYYSDTDSIVTDTILPDTIVNSTEIGKLKLEHSIDKGIFIAGKTYWLCNDKGEFINKAKGIKANSLSYLDYLNLLKNINVYTALKRESHINWSLGEVKISNKNITITSTGYTKRTKIYKDNLWVDTTPLFINSIDKSLIPYKNNFSLVEYKNIEKLFYNPIAYGLDVYNLSNTIQQVSVNTKIENTNKQDKNVDTDIPNSFFKSSSITISKFLFTLKNLVISLLFIISMSAYIIIYDSTLDENSESNVLDSESLERKLLESEIDILDNDITHSETNTSIANTNFDKNVDDSSDELYRLIEDSQKEELRRFVNEAPTIESKETLYQRFIAKISETKPTENVVEEVAKIDVENSNTRMECSDKSITKLSLDMNADKASLLSSKDRLDIGDTPNTSTFSPATFNELEKEIYRNSQELDEHKNKDLDINDKFNNLVDERRYLLDQMYKHLESELDRARKTPVNDLDLPQVHKDIEVLNTKIKELKEVSDLAKDRNPSFSLESNDTKK